MAIAGGTRLLLATAAAPPQWQDWARIAFPAGAELTEYVDQLRGVYRVAAFLNGRLEGCLFVGPPMTPLQWDTIKTLLADHAIDDRNRRMLLSGHSIDGIVETGLLVCACFGVGLATIRDAIVSGAATNVKAVGRALRA